MADHYHRSSKLAFMAQITKNNGFIIIVQYRRGPERAKQKKITRTGQDWRLFRSKPISTLRGIAFVSKASY